MGVRSSACEHVVAFGWWVGCLDLALLRDAVKEEIAAHAREVVEHEGVSWAAVASALRPSCEQAEGVQVDAAGQGVDGVQGQVALAAQVGAQALNVDPGELVQGLRE